MNYEDISFPELSRGEPDANPITKEELLFTAALPDDMLSFLS